MTETTAYLALGTNLGDRAANLAAARAHLPDGVRLLAASPIYETEPWGVTDQPAFLNQVIRVQTTLAPVALLEALKDLETRLGRQPAARYGPRLIDLDILFYGEQVLEHARLAIPHPRLAERAFVLVPLADLAPDLIHPRLARPVLRLLEDVDRSGVRPYQGPLPPPLPWGERTFVMGILNITPDSFSGDGLLAGQEPGAAIEAAVAQARAFAEDGADVLDLGAESTRPGAEPVDADEEARRLIPVLRAVRAVVDLPISVDTYKAQVALAALRAGANWINDVWALQADPDMARLAAQWRAPLVLMHNRSRPSDARVEARLGGRYDGVQYADLLGDIRTELNGFVTTALAAGIGREQIILDPGIGFGKTVSQNLALINRLQELKELGYPLLLGPSRKGFIGYTLDLPREERLEGTAAAVCIGIARGADIIRVHDVRAMARAARMTDAILRAQAK